MQQPMIVSNHSEGIYEIRWHGRGGQGAVTAAKIVAYAAFLDGYPGVTSAPFFGAERRGVPITAVTRLSHKPIYVISQVETPDALVILDQTLLKYADTLSGLKMNGWVIVNSSQCLAELDLPTNVKVATADATLICKELGLISSGIPVVNTALIGAFARATQVVSLESLKRAIKEKLPDSISETNMAAFIKTFQTTKVFTR